MSSGDFKPGNQFWKLRSKHGRDKIFATPEIMWEAACEYFQWCQDNPWVKPEQVKNPKTEKGKDTKIIVDIPTARPFTLQGLCLYLDVNTVYFHQFERNLKPAEKEIDREFSKIITRIRDTIYQQKYEGAAVGAFNANIIARDLGLTDKVDNTIANPDGTPIKLTLNLK